MTAVGFLNKLHFKVMLLFLLVSIVPLGIVSVFSVRTADELITNMVTNQLENVADDKADLLDRWLLERKADVQVIAGSSVLKAMDSSQIGPYLELVGEKYKVYKGFVVVKRDGKTVFSSSASQADCSDEKWFKWASEGKLYLSEIGLEPEWMESVFTISAPILAEEGTVTGAVCATIGTEAILSIVLRVSLGKTGECYLVDQEGTFLAHKEPRRILSENIAQSESFKNIFGGKDRKRIYTDYRGIEVLGATRSVPGTDWHLVVEQDRDEAFESADSLKRYVLAVMVLSLLVAIAVAWLLGYYIARPIERLSKAADLLARGEFEHARLKTGRTDEIGALYGAFGNMASQLQERHSSLEEKVESTETELKETDVKLRKTEEAAARSQQLAALGQLAAGVTHEIRTPLASLKLFLQSVQSEIEISPEYKEDFHLAMQQVKRIEATINRFLDFAKPQEPIFSTIDIVQLVDDSLLVVQPRANQQETIVKKEVEKVLPKMRGDKKQLGEVFLNLMVNALEAMPHKGTLTVAASSGRGKVNGKVQDYVRVDITDTGIGIDSGSLAKLFDPFFTTKASGTGLGLSIAHSTVRTHGGEIRVESKTRKGSTFSIFLPVLEKQEPGVLPNSPGKESDGENG